MDRIKSSSPDNSMIHQKLIQEPCTVRHMKRAVDMKPFLPFHRKESGADLQYGY